MKLPTKLKLALEFLSGYSLDDVNVHYDSDKPTHINAKAYAQGTDIYLASGEEEHLPHEAWHIVQQKQGRVTGNKTINGVLVNDDPLLEKEATLMGEKAKLLISKGVEKCKDLLTIKHNMASVAQLTTDPDAEDSTSPLIKIVDTKFPDSHEERNKKYSQVQTQTITGLTNLNQWLHSSKKTLDSDNEVVQALINKVKSKKPLPYFKYLKNEKAKFLAKWNDLNTNGKHLSLILNH